MNNDLDTMVECKTCGKMTEVNFVRCMRNGWPMCHNETMHLADTEVNIQEELKKIYTYKGFSLQR